MPPWSAERRDVPIARDVKTPRKRLACLASTQRCLAGTCVSRRSAPPRSPAGQKQEGKRTKRLRGGRRCKTTGRRSYAWMFENLVGSARLSHGKSGESRRYLAPPHAEEHRAGRLRRLPACAPAEAGRETH